MDAFKMLREKYKCPVWVSKDGSLTPLLIMNLRMMHNCYAMVNRQIAELVSPWAMASPSGSIAADMMDSMLDSGQADDEYSRKRRKLFAWKEAFEREFERRNIVLDKAA